MGGHICGHTINYPEVKDFLTILQYVVSPCRHMSCTGNYLPLQQCTLLCMHEVISMSSQVPSLYKRHCDNCAFYFMNFGAIYSKSYKRSPTSQVIIIIIVCITSCQLHADCTDILNIAISQLNHHKWQIIVDLYSQDLSCQSFDPKNENKGHCIENNGYISYG